MNHPASWNKLADLARRAPPGPAEELSPGFVTRVAARGLALRRERPDFLGAFARRALAFAFAVLVTAAAVSYPLVSGGNSVADDFYDPVGELVARL